MIIEVQQQSVQIESVSYREMGFGEEAAGFSFFDYRLAYGIDEAIALLRPAYNEWIRDQKEDDDETGDPYPRYFRDLNYPTIEELAKHHMIFADAVRRFFFMDLISSSFRPASAQEVEWIINSVHSVVMDDGEIVVNGKVFPKRKPNK